MPTGPPPGLDIPGRTPTPGIIQHPQVPGGSSQDTSTRGEELLLMDFSDNVKCLATLQHHTQLPVRSTQGSALTGESRVVATVSPSLTTGVSRHLVQTVAQVQSSSSSNTIPPNLRVESLPLGEDAKIQSPPIGDLNPKGLEPLMGTIGEIEDLEGVGVSRHLVQTVAQVQSSSSSNTIPSNLRVESLPLGEDAEIQSPPIGDLNPKGLEPLMGTIGEIEDLEGVGRSRSGSGGVGMNVRPRSRTSRSNGERRKEERLVTLDSGGDEDDAAPGEEMVVTTGATVGRRGNRGQ
ncbi:hypothetical protein NHX12_018622 [Muraenolepis orangiensis]|uniref:Uncharacterized protein n=1 Tax=Muraenolepis orangiensis TaxID=630683 RepID=A0A9Q0IXR8_9TELE|nr:hypothetical protein NHX12_018622 [Muraenolepis orangiensis]